MKKLIILLFLLFAGPALADDRTDLQTQINNLAAAGGGDLYLDAREYVLTQAPGQFYSLTLPGGVNLIGAGRDKTRLTQAPGAGLSERLIYVNGTTRVQDLSLFGNKDYQTADEHRAGLFIQNGAYSVIERVNSSGFTGDGFTVYSSVSRLTFNDVAAFSNGRDGLAITPAGTVNGIKITNSSFWLNAAQQIDAEPGPVQLSDVTISGCYISGGVSQYALAIAGYSSSYHTTDWTVIGNTIDGATDIVWAERVLFEGNRGLNWSPHPAVTVYRDSVGVTVQGNSFVQGQATVPGISGILVSGVSTVNMPSSVLVADNYLTSLYFSGYGVRLSGVTDAVISNNVVKGFPIGVYARATLPDSRYLLIRGNRILGSTLGISLAGQTSVALLAVVISENLIDASGIGVSVDDGYHSTKAATLIANTCLGTTTCLTNLPTGARVF